MKELFKRCTTFIQSCETFLKLQYYLETNETNDMFARKKTVKILNITGKK